MSDLTKNDVVAAVLPAVSKQPFQQTATAYTPVNFALIKYWGKEQGYENIMLPHTDSLSIAMAGHMGTETSVSVAKEDQLLLNGQRVDETSLFAKRVWAFVDLFRASSCKLNIETTNHVPTAAGLASSASGFAALTLALNDLFGWQLDLKNLSILARLGSGSAARSVYQTGFVEFIRGEKDDLLGSYAEPIECHFESLCVGILTFDAGQKAISSSKGMQKTVEGSSLYQQNWAQQVETDKAALKTALMHNDFSLLGQVAQRNAIAMHQTAEEVGVVYSTDQTRQAIQDIDALQEKGVELYFTQDAGPNLKLLAQDEATIARHFPDATVFKIL